MKAKDTPEIGCYLDHGSRNSEELSIDIVDLAEGYGYKPSKEYGEVINMEEDDRDEFYSEVLSEESDDAIDWLNGHACRDYCYWSNEGYAGAFGLWPDIDGAREDCGFISSKEQDRPDDGFVGLWMEVNDHGNATLYRRGRNGHDYEIWSVV